MPVQQTAEYYKLKLVINSKDGAISESYSMNPNLSYPNEVLLRAMNIVYLRGVLLAAGAAEVEATISKVSFASNKADGIAFSPLNLYGPILMKKINNSTSETAIEAYGEVGTGIRVELPAIDGRVEQRLIRFVRQSWIAQNQIQLVGVVPQNSGVYGPIIAAGFVDQPPWKAMSAFVSYLRDNTVMVRRLSTQFEWASFSSGGPDWSMIGVGKRSVGYGWPRQLGRQRNWS